MKSTEIGFVSFINSRPRLFRSAAGVCLGLFGGFFASLFALDFVTSSLGLPVTWVALMAGLAIAALVSACLALEFLGGNAPVVAAWSFVLGFGVSVAPWCRADGSYMACLASRRACVVTEDVIASRRSVFNAASSTIAMLDSPETVVHLRLDECTLQVSSETRLASASPKGAGRIIGESTKSLMLSAADFDLFATFLGRHGFTLSRHLDPATGTARVALARN